MFGVFLLLLPILAYKEETFSVEYVPTQLGIADNCLLYSDGNKTTLRRHDGSTIGITEHASDIFAINQKCDMVVFGYPDHDNGIGKVDIWYPLTQTIKSIRPHTDDISSPNNQVRFYRFGWSLDIQGHTWVVGAPGDTSMGYVFVYEDEQLHSCRTQYDTVCVMEEGICLNGFTAWRRKYNLGGSLTQSITSDVAAFQKKCMFPQTPNYVNSNHYGGGPLDYVFLTYFERQQFGYSVALTGPLGKQASLFISAPGDTERFMEDNDGHNFGLVYAWDLDLPTLHGFNLSWWKQSLVSPIGPPNLAQATYRAYGRDIAASQTTLVVSSYPLYQNTKEPFVLLYDCDVICVESKNRGISLHDIPGNALWYLDADDLTWSDGKTGYINAPEYQNNFIGKQIGVVGSNIILPEPKALPSPKVHRFGKHLRESHSYNSLVGSGTNTQHWAHNIGNQITHLWPCELGSTGGKPVDNSIQNCQKCDVAYWSDDGWLKTCDLCPVNKTTYETGQSICEEVVPYEWPGMSWEDTRTVMIVIVVSGICAWLLLLVCQMSITYVNRQSRRNYKPVNIV